MMETGYIPNITDEIQSEITSLDVDHYKESIRYDHALPLRGTWMRGEFSLENCKEPRIYTKGGELLVRIDTDQV